MILADVMDALGNQLDTIAGLRVFRFPPDAITPPAAIVGYPDRLDYDGTYARGMDRMTIPIVLVVGKTVDRATRDALSDYADGAGASSVKAVLEAGTYTAFDTVRVMAVEFDAITIAGVTYMGAVFELDVVGSGD